MDVFCRNCGEPVDTDEFHSIAEEQGSTYSNVAADFRKRGCVAVYGGKCSPVDPGDSESLSMAERAGIVYDMLGDDMDGAASMLSYYC